MGQTLLYALYMHYPIISSQYPTGLSTFIIPNLQMRKLDCRQVEKLAQDHTKWKWLNQDSSPSSMGLISMLCCFPRVQKRYKWKVQFSSITQSCPTLCDPMDCSMPGLPVYHQLQEFTQAHVHWVGDAIQPSHPLSSPSPPALNLSQHQGLFKWVSSSHQVAKVLGLQHQSFQWVFMTDFL